MGQKFKTFIRSPLVLSPFILLAGIVVLLFWQISDLLLLNSWVEHTDRVIAANNLLEQGVVNLENEFRGFIITGDPDFLAPYRRAKLKLPKTIHNFHHFLQNNPAQEVRIDRIIVFLRDWDKFAVKVINLKKMGRDLAPIVRTQRGKKIIDSIRTILGEMRSTEEQLKEQRLSSAHRQANKLYWILLISFIIITTGLLGSLRLRRLWEIANQDSEERFRLMIEGTRDYAIFMLDSHGYIESWNGTAQRLKGYTSNEVIGRHFSITYSREDISAGKPEEKLATAMRVGRVEEEGWRVRKNGSKFWANVILSAIYDHSNKVKGFVKITRDLTERKLIEDELRASEEKYRALIAHAHDGIVILNESGRIESSNHKIEKMFGYSSDELLNQAIEVLIPAWTPEREPGKNLDLFGKRKDSTEFPLDVSLGPIKTKKGAYITVIVRDISERKEIEKRRARLLAKEQKANLAKDEFLATLSHELRTPLTTILAWAQMLRTGKLNPEKTKRAITIMEQCAKAQGQLIDDLLDISRIQAGKLSLTIQKIDPSSLIAAAIDSTRSLSASKLIQIETTIEPSIKSIFADPARLQQILWNLITNSIKFSDQGGRIWITLKRVMSASGEHVQFEIRDKGKGIKPDFLPIIFERFTQADSSSTRAYGGLGLGLAIVRKLVEMHEGNVGVESPGEGKGATFIVSLPVQPKASIDTPSPKSELEPEASTLLGLKVLLVDDEADTREVFTEVLQSFGAEVQTAGSAQEALAIFGEFEPDILVSDIAMPVEDGCILLSKIRAQQSELGQTPALALTAYAGLEDIQRVHLAGFQAHIAKPVDSKELVLTISRVVGRKRTLKIVKSVN